MVGNNAYCLALINNILKLPYVKLPVFFSYHCDFVEDLIKWLKKFEKLISENEELFVSTTKRDRMMKCYTIIEHKWKEQEMLRSRLVPLCSHTQTRETVLQTDQQQWRSPHRSTTVVF